jgi:hypothetical protein
MVLDIVGILLTIVGILLVIAVPLVGFLYNRRKKLKAVYQVMWKKSSSLKPDDVLRGRPFYEYYYRREEDESIGKKISDKENVLVIGRPLAGKTRAVYQALTSLNKPRDVIIPKFYDITPESFSVPIYLKFWRNHILFIDDLHRFVELQNFEYLLKEFLGRKDTIVVATCRSGSEYEKAKNKMLEKGMDLAMTFKNPIEIQEVPADVGQSTAAEVGKSWEEVKFDGTIGSVFMPFSEMEKRFSECSRHEKAVMRAIKLLYISGIYEGNQVFPLEWIKVICKRYGLEGEAFEWSGWLEKLKDRELIKLEKNGVWAEETYLENVVTLEADRSNLDVFQEMVSTYLEVPAALFKLGNRAYDIGTIDLEKAAYMKIAIKAYEEAIKIYTKEEFPEIYPLVELSLRKVLDFCEGE